MCRGFFLLAILFIVKIDGSSIKKKLELNKCCPIGTYIYVNNRILICEPYPVIHNFSELKVFDTNMYDTGKNIEEVFTIVPGIIENDELFYNSSMDLNNFKDLNLYITESGILQIEIPNAPRKWPLVPASQYCVDFIINEGVLSETPHIWASFVDYEDDDYDDSDSEDNFGFVYATLVSCFFMLLVLVVYFMLPELQNLCGMILMTYVTCLFIAFFLLVNMQITGHSAEGCVRLTLGIYYFILASFCWMNVMSYDIWWTFRGCAKARAIHRRGEDFKFCMYALYGFGLPGIMTISMGVINKMDLRKWPWFIKPNIPEMGCFLRGRMKLYYLYIPMLILIICNWIFYLMTAYNIWRLTRSTGVLDSGAAGSPQAHRTNMARFMVYLKLSVVMGLNWLMEIISYLYPGKMWYITDFYNILIGLTIFLIFVCKKNIYKKLVTRYGCKRPLHFRPGGNHTTIQEARERRTTHSILIVENSV